MARIFGRKIIDARTNECVGRAFVFMRKGRISLIGFRPTRPVYPEFETQERATFWRQRIVFRSHPDPDFDHVPDDKRHS